jgi:hypothetical protein
MPSVEEHCAISKQRTGCEFRKLHIWIDEPAKFLGINHRIERHADTEAYRLFIASQFGEKAVIEWLFHIAIDNLQTAYKASNDIYGERTFNYYQFALAKGDAIFFDCGKLTEIDLLKKFNGKD